MRNRGENDIELDTTTHDVVNNHTGHDGTGLCWAWLDGSGCQPGCSVRSLSLCVCVCLYIFVVPMYRHRELGRINILFI